METSGYASQCMKPVQSRINEGLFAKLLTALFGSACNLNEEAHSLSSSCSCCTGGPAQRQLKPDTCLHCIETVPVRTLTNGIGSRLFGVFASLSYDWPPPPPPP
eukprot:2181354-Amphidinium_carterae.1